MNIRNATEHDLALFLEIQAYVMVGRFEPLVDLCEWFKRNIETHFVIEVDGKPAGMFMVEPVTAIAIAIKPEFRKQGLASAAVEDVRENLKTKVVAFVDSKNEVSKKFFDSLGFKKEQFDCLSSN